MIVGIILAAGESRRFPGNKLLFKWEGKPIIRRTLENALRSKINKIIVVLGHNKDLILETIKDLDDKVVHVYNEEYKKGMSTSVKTGVKYAYENYGEEIEGILITPGDTAWIPPEAYDIVIDKFIEKKPLIAVAAYQGRRGHPIIFHKLLISEILKINEETRGLKKITKKYRLYTLVVETPYPGVILDIDTYNDLNRVKYVLKK
ncbi:MAG: nucleotidyltransferase family protein [Staphylothermus sp.]|nr:nucleotidyltransferase family protein [Staphylothermus sp.]